MSRDPRYDILFEPVKIGPVTAKNRFYQVPHCNGMGHLYPSSMAEMRGIKAEGGWAVVCTEEVEISHTSEQSPLIEGRLWDDRDIPVFERMTDKIHAHGALAGIQPAYYGAITGNQYSREIPIAPSITPVVSYVPVQARAMDKKDIRDYRRWHRNAALRAKQAGFDIIVVYSGHDGTIPFHFLSRRHNQRSDEYGGSLENRLRLIRELLEDIRECIGCNICAAWNNLSAPIRCTQNPTMGEEWRKGWHPEIIPEKKSDAHILVVGAGPAGLEAARALGQRGYKVTLAEAGRELGGRVTRESQLPGLSEWARVRDYRVGQIQTMANVDVYPENDLTAEQVSEFGADHVAIATGARWRNDGFGRAIRTPIPAVKSARILTPDDVINGERPEGPVVIYDDDHYYMGSVMAELLVAEGRSVTLATTGLWVSSWTEYTLEQEHIERRLIKAGVEILARHQLSAINENSVQLLNRLTGETVVRAGSLVSVTARLPRDELYSELMANPESLQAAGIQSVRRIGDCYGPATIAAAVYEGHRYARELDTDVDSDGVPFKLVSYNLELG